MRPDFDGPELLVGEISALRTFDLRAGGSLWPVFAADRAWQDGPNEARCSQHEVAGAPGCMCGFWAYGSMAALRDQQRSRNVVAVVSCWGRVTPGTRGIRAQFSRIEAVWLSRRVPTALVRSVAARYPSVAIYRDRARMLAEHPITELPSYVPDRPLRRSQARLGEALVGVFVIEALVLGLLPGRVYDAHRALSSLLGQVQLLLACAAISTLVPCLMALLRDPPRARFVARVMKLPAILMLLLWVYAPVQSLAVGLAMRVLPVVWLVRVLYRWTLRYQPAPAPPSA
ncbi:hypothetical protein [uncultured Jatrophihabitans sp.]|uniref:hypothetical protein n=1 Tax=uncultured Jatrophihabitans sp. TaxID=1610747 RepID=UPI0035CB4BB3